MQKKQTLKRSESVAFCGLAIALITIGAWVTVPLGPVPFTLQTMVLAFVVLLLPAREAVQAYLAQNGRGKQALYVTGLDVLPAKLLVVPNQGMVASYRKL